MKKQLYKIIFAGSVLLLASNCSGMRPFYQTGSVPAMKPQITSGLTVKHCFHPTSGILNDKNKDMISIQKDRKWKVSASLPVKLRFDF